MADKESDNMEHQVFISYATEKGDSMESKDRQVADKVCIALESEGIQCWIAPRNIMPGDDWLNSIIDAVEKSKVLILIFSSNANHSQWVNDEIKLALDKNIKIIPFRIDDVPPQGALRVLKVRCHWMDAYTPPLEKYLKKLIEVIYRHLGKKPGKLAKNIKVEEQLEIFEVKSDINEKEKKDKADKEKIKEFEEMPEDVRDVASKGINVEKNKKGLWEADYGDNIVMVYIPPGEFTMGSNDDDDEKPPHNIILDEYWMGKTEVTVAQFKTFVDVTGYVTEAEKSGGAYVRIKGSWKKKKDANWKNPYFLQEDKHPVVCVSWNDANAYYDWLSKKTGLKFKLPTEAQWEKAARGEDGRKYPWGNSPPSGDKVNFADKQAWIKEKFDWADKDIDDGYAYTSPVGTYPQGVSPYGLMDMAGNVWEWCADWYGSDYYKKSPDKNPMGPKSGTGRVLRGGGWSSDADYIRCAVRFDYDPSNRVNSVGFRLCQDKH